MPKEVQSYILSTSSAVGMPQYYVMANYKVMHVGPRPLRALVLIVKYDHVFDLEFDIDLLHFYDFIEYTFGLKKEVNPSIDAFIRRLKSV